MCQSLFVVTLYSQMSVGADGCHETHYYNMILRIELYENWYNCGNGKRVEAFDSID